MMPGQHRAGNILGIRSGSEPISRNHPAKIEEILIPVQQSWIHVAWFVVGQARPLCVSRAPSLPMRPDISVSFGYGSLYDD
jgi:hypothetical protein